MSFVEDIRLALNWAKKLCQLDSSDSKPKVKRLKLTKSENVTINNKLNRPQRLPRLRISEVPRVRYENDLEPILRKRKRKTPPKRRLTLDLTLRNYQSRFKENETKRVYLSPSKGVRIQEDEEKPVALTLTHNPFTGAPIVKD
mmetsp:Transcript_24044/g.42726  ORF Transcript_24044/g.42726 Transcript_24044/m.42726 type:complete len:143 (+) Transcript_24044:329-757(+)